MDVTIPSAAKDNSCDDQDARGVAATKFPRRKPRGIFKLFLGYAPGVGKTYSMLSEAIRRASRGEDVAVGVVESHGRKATAELAGKLDRIPPRKLEYKGTVFDEMDVDAILARKPAVVVIDELAHTNIEGSKHAKRYEDVMELLEAKIDVLSTMNVQHVESVGPTVQQITGVQVRETVPDWVMQRVDEIVLADLTPQALQKRMERGDIYPVDRAQRALSHFFRPGNLIALRELALRQVTGVVDRSLDAFLEKDGDAAGAHGARAHWRLRQFESGGAISHRPRLAHGPGHGRRALRFLYRCRPRYPPRGSENAGGKYSLRRESRRPRRAQHPAAASPTASPNSCARHHITQVIFGRSARTGWQRYLYMSAIQRFLRDSPSVDVHIVTQEAR